MSKIITSSLEIDYAVARLSKTDPVHLISWMTQQTPVVLALILGMVGASYRKHPNAMFWQIVKDVEKKVSRTGVIQCS